MYCKHCGREIDDNSSFCKYCGKSQDNCNKSSFNKPVWIIYLIWVISNLYLLKGEKNADSSSYFYPFTNHSVWQYYYGSWDKYFYDYSEFLVYVFIIPATIYIIYQTYNKLIDKYLKK